MRMRVVWAIVGGVMASTLVAPGVAGAEEPLPTTIPDPDYFEPDYTETTYLDPGYLEPEYVEPDFNDPGYIDSEYADSEYPDPTYSGPTYSDDSSLVAYDDPYDSLGSLTHTEVVDLTAVQLLMAIDALVELGAGSSEDPQIDVFAAELATAVPALGLGDVDYRFGLRFFGEDWPTLLAALQSSGSGTGDAIEGVEEVLNSLAYVSVTGGQPAQVEVAALLEALADLVVREGASFDPDEAEESEQMAADMAAILVFVDSVVGPQALAFVDPASDTVEDDPSTAEAKEDTEDAALTVETDVSQDSTEATEPGDGAGLVPLAVGGAGGGLGLLGIALLVRRRSATNSDSGSAAHRTSSTSDLLDVSRQMTATSSPEEIADIAIGAAATLVGSTGGLLVIQSGAEIEPLSMQPASGFILSNLETIRLRRVLDTGQPMTMVVESGPTSPVVGDSAALASMPIVSKGSVVGALLVARAANEPFERDDLEMLELLAPLVGSALGAAADLGSAARLADVEPMTGLKNRRCLDRDLADIDRESVMSYLMIDIDYFKNFNDTNGHAAGDEALRQVAATLSDSVRDQDVVYRYGGEEFCVLLPGATATEASVIAERVREGIETTDIPGGENQPDGRVTVSIGVADTAAGRPRDLVERADAALYVAKRAGRNRVQIETDSAQPAS